MSSREREGDGWPASCLGSDLVVLRRRGPVELQPEGGQSEIVGRADGERDRGDGVTWPLTPTARKVDPRLPVLEQAERQERGLRGQAGLGRGQQDLERGRLAERPACVVNVRSSTRFKRQRLPGWTFNWLSDERLVADQGQLDLGVGQEEQVLARIFDGAQARRRSPRAP